MEMKNVAMIVGAVIGIAILLFLHYKKGMKWKWSVILGYAGFSFVMDVFYTMAGHISGPLEFVEAFFMILSIPVLLLFVFFFVIGLIMDALGLNGGRKEKKETELERMQREQRIREASEKFRPRL